MKCSDLAFIVLNYNSGDVTVKCVDNLLSFAMDFQIIIVDNKSQDGSFQRLKNYYKNQTIDIIETKSNKGYSAGNNVGIRFAEIKYDIKYIAIINPDVIIPSGSLISEMLGTLKDYCECAVIGAMPVEEGKVCRSNAAWDVPSEIDFIKSKSIFYKKPNEGTFIPNKKIEQVDCVAGCFFIAKIDALKKIDYLDEDLFMYDEEILLGYKLREKNYCELLRTDLQYYHNHIKAKSPTLKNYIPKRRIRFASDVTISKKIYKNQLGLILLYINEYINRLILFFWFAYKELRNRRK